MEGIDSFLRSTRNYDVFNCIERFSCEMAAPLSEDIRPVSMQTIENYSRSFRNAYTNLSDLSALEEEEPLPDAASPSAASNNFLQPGIPANGQILQPGLPHTPQLLPQQFPYYPQPFYPPLFPYPLYPTLPQASQASAAAAVTGHSASAPALASDDHGAAKIMVHPHIRFRDAVKRNDDASLYRNDFSSRSIFAGYRERILRGKRRYKNWWKNMQRKMGRKKRDVSIPRDKARVLRRYKRGILSSLKRLWNGRQIVGVLDRMMEGTDDSLYPYTRAALMGYTGDNTTCASLYPNCPTSMDEAIDTFNNLRRYFPEGIPFRDRVPAPFRYLIP